MSTLTVPAPCVTPTPTPTTKPPKHIEDPTIWHPTGDIILACHLPPTSPLHLFRVHALLLSLHSPVLRDMLSAPHHGPKSHSHPRPRQMHAGVPVYYFKNVHPGVLGVMLSHMYNPTYAPLPLSLKSY
ncbi:hypothetical protein B0H34DRAFT_724966 [Crassisporium funariophilum]|nr:hypothetical protein B0H34DRAFT_724966 [Crassisporium funariophilum]